MLLGRLIDGTKHYILKAAHPSGLSANRGFFGCRFAFTLRTIIILQLKKISFAKVFSVLINERIHSYKDEVHIY